MSERTYERFEPGTQHPRMTDQPVMVESQDAPQPGAESVGPTMFDMVKEIRRAQEVSQFLMNQAQNLLKRRTVVVKAFDATSAAGVLELNIYQVPQGFQLMLTRWNVEAVGYNPSAPYKNAAGQLILYNGIKFAVGSMIDFLPNPPVSNGEILPAAVTDGAAQAGLFRGGEWVSLRISGGPASTQILARIQGIQEAV